MNSIERGVTGTATVFLTAAVVLATTAWGWPWWLWIPSALVPSAAAVLVDRALARERATGHVPRSGSGREEVPVPTAPSGGQPATGPAAGPGPDTRAPTWPHTRRTTLSDVSLASAVDDYRFLFSATVCWLPDPTPDRRTELHANPAALAREAVVSRARRLLADGAPEEYDPLTERLAATLGTVLSVPAGHLHVWAENIAVRLSDEDDARIRRLAGLRKDEAIREHERHSEREERAYLAGDVLRDPGRAVVWFLARTADGRPVDLDTVVHRIDDLRRLTAAAHATEIPPCEAAGPGDAPEAPDAPDTALGRPEDDPALYPPPTSGMPGAVPTGPGDGAAGSDGTGAGNRAPTSGHM